MIRLSMAVMTGIFLAAAPLHAQTSHGAHGPGAAHPAMHEHGQQQHEHCPKHGDKHADTHGDTHGDKHGHSHAGAADAVHRYAPKMLLQQREALQLMTAQVEALEALQAGHKADCERRMALVKAAEQTARAALSADTPDLAVYEASLREAATHKVDCKVDMARIGQAGSALLTAEQRARYAHTNHAGH